jgi:hypothetical protein
MKTNHPHREEREANIGIAFAPFACFAVRGFFAFIRG